MSCCARARCCCRSRRSALVWAEKTYLGLLQSRRRLLILLLLLLLPVRARLQPIAGALNGARLAEARLAARYSSAVEVVHGAGHELGIAELEVALGRARRLEPLEESQIARRGRARAHKLARGLPGRICPASVRDSFCGRDVVGFEKWAGHLWLTFCRGSSPAVGPRREQGRAACQLVPGWQRAARKRGASRRRKGFHLEEADLFSLSACLLVSGSSLALALVAKRLAH